MKLLIVCQTFDENHPVLGFFVRWVTKLAKHFDSIQVIALSTGLYTIPKNVSVRSLGKGKGGNRVTYIINFYKNVFSLKEYDAVFVHMNPEYLLLAGWWWKLRGKRIGLWYNHTVGSLWLRLAHRFTNLVFHTSPYAYTARYKNAVRMPAGIDINVFKLHPEVQKIPRSLYFQGRVSPAKRVHAILEAFNDLYKAGEASFLTIVGPEDENYVQSLKGKYAELIEKGVVVFKGPVPHHETPLLYNQHAVSINLTDDGNYDKTVLESIACGTPVVYYSGAFDDILEGHYKTKDLDIPSIMESIKRGFDLEDYVSSQRLRELIIERHSLTTLASRISKEYAA